MSNKLQREKRRRYIKARRREIQRRKDIIKFIFWFSFIMMFVIIIKLNN